MSVKIGLIEPIVPSDTLNYKPFFKHCNLQIIFHVFLCLYLYEIKHFVLKAELYFSFFIWFGLGFGVTVLLKALCF